MGRHKGSYPAGNSALPIIGELELYPQKLLMYLISRAEFDGMVEQGTKHLYFTYSTAHLQRAMARQGLTLSRRQMEVALFKLEQQGFIKVGKKGRVRAIYLLTYHPPTWGNQDEEEQE